MAQKSDERRYPRADTYFEVQYKPAQTFTTEKTFSHDLSASGISFEVSNELKKGDTLELRLILKDAGTVIDSKGRIVRIWQDQGKTLAAVEFVHIDYEDFITILDYSLAHLEE